MLCVNRPLAFLITVECRRVLSSTLCNASSFFTRWSTDPFHPSPAPSFKHFQIFLITFPKCPTFSTTQSYDWDLTLYSFLLKFEFTFLLKNILPFAECCICHGNPGFNFTLRHTPCIIYYHAAKIRSWNFFHILQLFLIYHHLYWESFSWNSYYRSFFLSFFPHSFTYHTTFQFQLIYQSCPVVPCQKVRYCSITSPKVSSYRSICLLYQIQRRVFRRTDVGSVFLLVFMRFFTIGYPETLHFTKLTSSIHVHGSFLAKDWHERKKNKILFFSLRKCSCRIERTECLLLVLTHSTLVTNPLAFKVEIHPLIPRRIFVIVNVIPVFSKFSCDDKRVCVSDSHCEIRVIRYCTVTCREVTKRYNCDWWPTWCNYFGLFIYS